VAQPTPRDGDYRDASVRAVREGGVTNWKHAERRVAKAFGTTRTGPTGRDDSDLTHPIAAIEVKYRKALPAWALACLEQARTGRTAAGKVPMVVMLGRGMRITDGLVVMRVADFQELFGEIQTKEAAVEAK
jgi:hypothetical protein